MPLDHAVRMFHQQADACAQLGSPLSAALLHRAAEDIAAGGPCADAVAGHQDAPGPAAIALRLLGAVHALVLTGRAPDLAAHYPSAGGTFDPAHPDPAWPAFRAVVAAHLPEVREWMTRPPQTNEVGRANLLITGLLYALGGADFPVRLYELGSSAGLNLLADRFRIESPDLAYGPADSPVVLLDAWRGAAPGWLHDAPPLRFAVRQGCDPTPIDPLSPDGALALRAYVWADQPARFARLDGALRLAADTPPRVDPVGAAAFLRDVRPADGALTVVWHSVMRQYVPKEEWARVETELARLADASTERAPFAHIALEPHRVGEEHRFLLTVRRGAEPRQILAEAVPHGLPAWTVTEAELGPVG
ncbi:DUF2332 domain-containing protein [Kitasatospora paracochleata]|uniref:DUF2332 domain-containing protein n=1 Tax=Kitasatospora paracochleata TaxID=58354 RepID=A0ABT1IYB3_9ACTN|nr:DUF2332 domain-containing protein [Kitasatospora paracochleata]MCP2310128.1 hypothetical protein [Kitasatospora paracochleata]